MMGMRMGWGATDQAWRKGPWTPEEDKLLTEYVNLHGEGRWSSVAKSAGLNRSGKSCRLRWVNYLRPGLKRGQLTPQEEGIIIELHALWGNKWSTIARYLPGRTDNEIKNYWRTHFRKKEKSTQKQEKRKAQLLKQKQQLQQQQQQQQQEDNMTINWEVSSQDADTKSSEKITEEHAKQQTAVLIHPTMADQCLPVTYQEGAAPWSDQFVVDEGLWCGLWNLDDPPLHANQDTSNCNKIAMQNQATAFNFGGDPNYNFYNYFNGGYIF